ncbi:MAG TPA: putative peptidoglycan glycosyltransferase FtsW [Candidatus Saccharimonadales bacterium]
MGAVTRRHPTYIQDRNATRRHRPDYLLLVLMIALAAVGVIVVFSISPAIEVEKGISGNQYILKQIIAVLLGLVLFGVGAAVPIDRWGKMWKPLVAFAAAATLIALLMPVNANYPAHRWIRMAGFSFQSVELLKFAGIMWLASFLSWRIKNGLMADRDKTLKPLFFAFVGVAGVVAFMQSDFGSFMVIVAMMFIMSFVAGLPVKKLFLAAAVLAILGTLLISAMPYRRARLTAFMHPDCLSSGYQACQALIAVGSGGMIGLGLGRSVQAYGYLPEAENDSIFAIYAEKFGFIGVTILLGLFAAFFTRIRRIAERAPDDFSRLVVMGVLVWLSAQTIVNIGAMIGLLPLKGITLPLVSYGGSSVLAVMGALGVVFQVSRHTLYSIPEKNEQVSGATYDDSSDRRRVRGAYHPAPGRRP